MNKKNKKMRDCKSCAYKTFAKRTRNEILPRKLPGNLVSLNPHPGSIAATE